MAKYSLFPSEFTQHSFRMPDATGKLTNFDFTGREYLLPIYDSPDKNLLLKFGRQCEKTVQEDTPVLTSYGEWKAIKDVAEGEFVVTMLHDGAHLGHGKVVWKSRRYKKRCVRVTTQLGHVVDLGFTHPVRQWDTWTIADVLRPGDRVASVRAFNALYEPSTELTKELVAFVGYMLGDGSLINSIGFTQDGGSPVLTHFREICSKHGWSYREYTKEGSSSVDLRFNKTDEQAYGFLKKLGAIGASSEGKKIPDALMRLPDHLTIELLQAMWACDGHVKQITPSRYEIVYCTISQKMAQQVRSLLWKLGIPTRLRVQTPKVYVGTDKRAFLVHVRTREGITRFLQKLTVLGKPAPLPESCSNDCKDSLPIEAALELHSRYKKLPCKHGNTRHAHGGAPINAKYPPTRRKFADTLAYLAERGAQVEDLTPHASTDLFWDTVVAVEDIGEQFCYDLEVDGTHNFIAGGLVTHNSTSLGNKLISFSVLQAYLRSLYVTPSEQQTTVFSSERISTPIEMSPDLQSFMRGSRKKRVVDNVLLKVFNTGSRITFRYAHYDADSTRGVSGDRLVVDEIQDILIDVLPVLEETISHSPIKTKEYAGTPKTFDNAIEYYWAQFSTQNEWVIPCDHCGGGDYRYWNVISYESVQRPGLCCTRCGKRIESRHPSAQWASMRDEAWLRNPPNGIIPFSGYRIAQPMVSWLKWEEVYDKKMRYTTAKFHNEVLGLSYDSGEKLVNRQALIDSSNPDMPNIEFTSKYVGRSPLFMGIDWGGGSETNSFTAVSIIGYDGDKIAIPYMKRFTGLEAEPGNVVNEVCKLIDKYKVHLVGCDYGGGLDRNDALIRRYGMLKILRYQYVNTKRLYFDGELMRWMVNRTECLMAMINAINRTNVFMFPRWETWEYTCAPDFEALLLERNNRNNTSMVSHTPGIPDDIAHSLLYAFLASMLTHPRPDILMPDKERNGN